MNDLTDQQLLCDYAARRAEPAFAELVRRHIDLVYSAAIRMVRDTHLAEDVTQRVFAALAQNAPHLVQHPVLSGWLHRTAQNLASKSVRSEVRRRAHEQEAAAMNELISTGSNAEWEQISPHLDAALSELSESDRDAVLLRYFERKSAPEMAERLGISSEAAQKRVNRAVERLRESFSKRGVAIGASGLVIVISTNAVQSAPAGLAIAVASAALAGTTIVSTATITAAKSIAMTTLQKTIITVALAAALGAGIYEAHQTSAQRTRFETLQQQQAAQIQQLQHERDDATNRLASLLAENGQLKSNHNSAELLKLRGEVTRLRKAGTGSSTAQSDPRENIMKSWLAREDKLKEMVKQNPGKTIPEFQFLSEEDWVNAARNANFDTDKGVQESLAGLRHAAENHFATMAHSALKVYMDDNNGQFPTGLSQLQPYFDSPMDEAILSRWQIVPQSDVPNIRMGPDWVITEKAPVDTELDQQWAIGPNGYGASSYQPSDVKALLAIVDPALKAYAAANPGKEPADPSQILPYLTTPEQQAAFQTLMKHEATRKASSK